jgi:hypothetical protein
VHSLPNLCKQARLKGRGDLAFDCLSFDCELFGMPSKVLRCSSPPLDHAFLWPIARAAREGFGKRGKERNTVAWDVMAV